jgi:hypothetical protein
MAIANFPAALQPAIQTNYLDKRFQDGLESVRAFRDVADKMVFPARIGQTITDTRSGLKSPVTTPANTANNTNFDNGMTPSTIAIEQYTVTLNRYQDTIDLDMVGDMVGIAPLFVENAYVNGVQAAQSLERLARDALFNPYMGGNTRARVSGTGNTVVSVDDIRGFQTAPVLGVQTAISGTNTLTVTVGANAYTLTGVTADGTNVSTAPNGTSGTLTFSGSVVAGDAVAGTTIQAANASIIIRPNGRTNTSAIVAGDLLSLGAIQDARAALEGNNVPKINGCYNFYADPYSMRQLFADADFKALYRVSGSGVPATIAQGHIVGEFLGVRFIATTETYIQIAPSVPGSKIRRAILVGAGALIEADFAGMATSFVGQGPVIVKMVDGIVMVTRQPLDRLGMIIAQSWYWIGGFTAPSDITVSTSIIPTSSNAAFKRAVIIEHLG